MFPGKCVRSRCENYLRYALAAVIFAACLASSSLSKDPDKITIRNFGQINQNYYRGAQPKEADFTQLGHLGIKTVIDLRDKGKAKEPTWARSAGMQYIKIPLSSRRPPTPAQTEYFLKLANNPENWPIFVHCAGGKHRTGVMTAIYRIANDFWDADRSYKEMKKYHFYSFGGHGSLKRYVYDYYRSFSTNTTTDAAKTTK
jgi:protein tyrosine/serine phosphatase